MMKQQENGSIFLNSVMIVENAFVLILQLNTYLGLPNCLTVKILDG